MRRRLRIAVPAALAVLAVLAVSVGAAGRDGGPGEDDGPRAAIPRVCWFSDYANARLSNRCAWRGDERRWYMDVNGRQLPADEQRLPPANLCLYFHGTSCPTRAGDDADPQPHDEGSDDDRVRHQ